METSRLILKRKNKASIDLTHIFYRPLSYVCKYGFIVEYDVFVIGRDDLHPQGNGAIILVRQKPQPQNVIY